MQASVSLLAQNPLLQVALDAADMALLVVNGERQVLAANAALNGRLGTVDLEALVGFRPGELLGCVHALEEGGGCGTAEACAGCGLAHVVLECQRTRRSAEHEVLMTVEQDEQRESLELFAKASPLSVGAGRLAARRERREAA